MRAVFVALVATLACARAFAQAAPPLPSQESPPLDPRKNQKIEHIHVEDKSVKIDELRYAGQTQSITVKPKDGLPTYEIQTPTPSRQQLEDGRRGTVAGERVWNVLAF